MMKLNRGQGPDEQVSSLLGITAVTLALLVLGGCSWVPDAVNPVEWNKGVVGWFEDDKEGAQSGGKAADAKPVPGADKAFPSLATVPDRPKRPSDEERRKLAQGLASDRQEARYSDEVIRRQTEGTAVSPVSPPKPPAISAVPSTPPAPRIAAPPPRPPISTRAPAMAPSPRPAPPQLAAVPPVSRDRIRGTGQTRRLSKIMFSPPPSDIGLAVEPAAGISSGAVGRGFVTPAGGRPPAMARSSKVATVLFPDGSARISRQSRRILSDVVRLHRSRGGNVRVIGHASSRTREMDWVRHKMVNLNVSLDRANAVASALIRSGVRAGNVSIEGRSDLDPVYFESMPSGEMGNRRADIYIDY